MVTNMKKHMETHNRADESNTESADDVPEAVAGNEDWDNNENVIIYEMENVVNKDDERASDQDDDEQENGNNKEVPLGDWLEGQIVLVLRKTIHWPAKILRVKETMVEVEIFDKTKTKETRPKSI